MPGAILPGGQPPASGPPRPDADAVREFAAELNQLRRAAGSPSYRELARRTHYSSSTLAEATRGQKPPSQAVVEAFAKACGADPLDWIIRWRNLAGSAAGRQQDGTPGAGDLQPETAPGAPGPRDSARSASRHRARLGSALRAAAVAVTAAIAGAAGYAALAGRPAPASPTRRASVPAVDGADPVVADCTGDATTLGRVAVTLAGKQIGVLELRYSPHCRGGWARFYQLPNLPPTLVGVQVSASDGRAAAFTTRSYGTIPVYTNILLPGPSCLRASVTVHRPQGLLHAATPCLTVP